MTQERTRPRPTITYEQLAAAPVSDLPAKTLIDAWFDGTKHMHDFAEQVMLPQLRALFAVSPREEAIRDTYFRLCLFLRSIVALNRLDHVQTVAASARSIFELWIELELLARDQTDQAAAKQRLFAEVERFKHAEQIIRYAADNPGWEMNVSAQKAFCSEERRARLVKDAGASSWSDLRKRPHWTGKDLRQRARDVDQESAYIQLQPLLSWYVHSGAAGTAGMSRVGLEAVFAISHIHTQRMFLAATGVCAKVTKIAELPQFSGWMTDMLYKSGRLVVNEQIKQLEERAAATKSE